MVKEIMYALEWQAQLQKRGSKRVEVWAGWSWPDFDWLKLNTDGAPRSNGTEAVAGSLIRDELGC